MRTEHWTSEVRKWPLWLCGTLASALFDGQASADLKLDTYLSSEAEYDSNVFRVSSATAQQALGTTRRDDEILNSEAGANVEYRWDQQRLYASGEVNRILYQRNSALDHNEYQWLGGTTWKLSTTADGGAEYKMARRMVPEENRATPNVSLDFEMDRSAGGSANLMINPQWRLESRIDWIEQDSPSPDARFHL